MSTQQDAIPVSAAPARSGPESEQPRVRKSGRGSRKRILWLLGRLAAIPISLFFVVTISFAVTNMAPGDPAQVVAGPVASPEQVEAVRHELGLDRSLMDRYKSYVLDLRHGDLGNSYYSKRPVIEELRRALPNTIELVLPALVVSVVLGLAMGGVAGYYRSRAIDRGSRALISFTQSIPDFLAGLLMIYVFFAVLNIVPSPVGRLGITEAPTATRTNFQYVDSILNGDWVTLNSLIAHGLVPTLALGIVYSAYFAKTTRSVLRKELDSKYVEFARSCGIPERQVFGYALRVGRTQLLTYAAILFGGLVGGTAIIEIVFSWRGVGAWGLDGIMRLDLPVVQAFILFSGLVTLATYLTLDIVTGILDPRISRG
ncbi:ABC transporter permease [Nocardioides sp. AE5]|uniref:ABC transporter permease n=1 Tax=Nocardioides sp. AE5 TaxID=2962573 RepID=UPI0028828DE7|nr:ABC transporter permease [Nocardioides sp. AE5]MDT0202475.1 ABC transporter permease [Nocardioides sp. AE5]